MYFLRGEGCDPIKIGFTRCASVKSRIAELQPGCPVQLRELASCGASVRAEQALHRLFALSRLHNEWFAPVHDLELLIEILAEAHRPGLWNWLDGAEDTAKRFERAVA